MKILPLLTCLLYLIGAIGWAVMWFLDQSAPAWLVFILCIDLIAKIASDKDNYK